VVAGPFPSSTTLRYRRQSDADLKVIPPDLNRCCREAWPSKPTCVIREAVWLERQSERRAIQSSIAVEVLEDGDGINPRRDLTENEADRAGSRRDALPEHAGLLIKPSGAKASKNLSFRQPDAARVYGQGRSRSRSGRR